MASAIYPYTSSHCVRWYPAQPIPLSSTPNANTTEKRPTRSNSKTWPKAHTTLHPALPSKQPSNQATKQPSTAPSPPPSPPANPPTLRPTNPHQLPGAKPQASSRVSSPHTRARDDDGGGSQDREASEAKSACARADAHKARHNSTRHNDAVSPIPFHLNLPLPT
jgi:hypothetical protein